MDISTNPKPTIYHNEYGRSKEKGQSDPRSEARNQILHMSMNSQDNDRLKIIPRHRVEVRSP